MRPLLLMPSFWGGLTWTAWLVLYQLRLIKWEESRVDVLLFYWIVAALFVISTIVMYKPYRSVVLRFDARRDAIPVRSRWALDPLGPITGTLHFLSFVGLGLYVYALAAGLGGVSGVMGLLLNPGQAHFIRQATLSNDYAGLELTYFGWAAIFLTVIGVSNQWLSRWWYLLAAVQFAGNLLLVDRTRPVWIAFVFAILMLLMDRGATTAQLLRRLGLLLGGVIAFFVAYAIWSGRLHSGNPYGETLLPPWAQSIYYYGTSGYAYFNRLVEDVSPGPGVPERLAAPVIKIAAVFGVTDEPPAEILDFFHMPFATNVGTFVEPFYQDGGWLLVVLGILLYSFVFNFLGLWLIAHGKPFSLILWANLCFTSFIGFFVPKVGSTALWLFLILAVCGLVIPRKRTLVSRTRKVTQRAFAGAN